MDEEKILNRNEIILFSLFFILAIIIVILGVRIFTNTSEKNKQTANETYDYSPELASIQAKSFYVYDVNGKKALFAKNEHEQLPIASITKLMSGLIITENLPATSTIVISKEDIAEEGDTGLLSGEKWSAVDLLDFSLMSSSNDGIHALSRTLNEYEGERSSSTIDLMNKKAKTLELANTIFFNETGLDVNTDMGGAYSSACDIAVLLQKILENYPSLVSKTTEESASFVSENGIKHIAINTDMLVNKIPGLIASKTGYTDLAGGNLVIAFDAGPMHPVIISLLGSTEKGRFSDMEQLVHVALEKLSE